VFTNDDPLNSTDSSGLEAEPIEAGGPDVEAEPGTPEGNGAEPGDESSTAGTIAKALSKLMRGLNYPVVDDESQLMKLFKQFIKGGVKIAEEDGPKGVRVMYKLSDDTTVQYRSFSSERSGEGPALDITYPDGQVEEVHIK
jgi:hypothetical protein